MADTNVMKQIADKIKDSNNILVTVNTNPSVDELSAALGITLLMNKLGKHATAVFSGAVPPAIKFLEPEKTFEHTVDSLRDFIIALDKEKADHLRYKVVDDMVKIFITPYRTTISKDDLDFSQGDYNVEMVLAIGVQSEADLDHALESHGRILHDATVAAISLGESTKLGGIEWVDGNASSYSEMLYALADTIKSDKAAIDEQISTALLTGIVAATDRFSNSSTTSNVMTIAAHLMSAGANQQLIANELKVGVAVPASPTSSTTETSLEESESKKDADDAVGGLSISHMPEGTIEQVTDQVQTKQSEAAARHAEEELAKQKESVARVEQADATEEAEQKLAAQLAVTVPAASSVALPASLPPLPAAPPQSGPLRGPVALDQWRESQSGASEPTLGGTLNATSEQAAIDNQRELADDRNHTILTHAGNEYVSGEPIFQAPLNATVTEQHREPSVVDVFAAGGVTAQTSHVEAIQPPAPAVLAPTLAEIDAQNRTAHSDAMSAVNAAFDIPTPDSSTRVSTLPPLTSSTGMPPLPPLPPMPDFSTLPPLPPSAPPLPSALSPLDAVPQPALATSSTVPSTPLDPSQFKIPGQ